MPCPKTTLIYQPKYFIPQPNSPRMENFVDIMASSTPARSRRESRDEDAHAGSPPSRETAHLDATVRFPPRNSLRLFASAEMRDLSSLASATRQISAARNRPDVPTSQASSFEVLRHSQMVSPAVSATRDEPRSRRNSPPNQANSPRYPPPVTRAAGLHKAAHEDSAGHVLVQAVTQLAEQMAAQSAAQMSALSTIMSQFEEMRTAPAPSQPNQPTTAHQPARPSVFDVNALAGAPLSRFPPPSALTPIPHADAYATMVAASRVNPQTTEPLALPKHSTVAGHVIYPANESNPQRVSPLAQPTPSAVPGAAVFALNQPTTHVLQPSLQYISASSQYAPVRVTSTVSGPSAPQPVAPSALHALAAFATAQPAAHSPTVISQIASSAGAPFAVAQPEAPFQAACAQFAVSAAAQPAVRVGAQPAVYALPAAPTGAQPADFAADWDEKETNTLLKLSSRACFTEPSGSKIRGLVADFELYLRMCVRPVYHMGYFLLASLGTEEAKKVRRSLVAESVADYLTFKKGVETLFKKFEFKGSYRAMLRTQAQAGAESVAAYSARTTDVCSKAYASFSIETQLSLAVDHFIAGLADSTSRDYLLHDRACRPLTWQKAVQMAQACKVSRILLNATSTVAAAESTKVGAPSLDDGTCAPAERPTASAWQQKSARDGRAKAGAQSSRKENSRAQTSASRPSNPQQNFISSAAHEPPSPYLKSKTAENFFRAPSESAKNSDKHRPITCFKCGKSGHVASACNSDAKPPRKCYVCGGVNHMARDCSTRAAQSKS